MNREILLIEDNEQNRYLATFLLEKHGYTVIPAPDGALGIELAGRLLPQLILLDIQLPVMDGLFCRPRTAKKSRATRNFNRSRDILRNAGGLGKSHQGRLQRLYRKTDQPRDIR